MNDPRWQRAMERLGVCSPCHDGQHTYAHGLPPDPDDPATFLRVVEALLKHDVTITFHPDSSVELEVPMGTSVEECTLYEAVMEAFGGER